MGAVGARRLPRVILRRHPRSEGSEVSVAAGARLYSVCGISRSKRIEAVRMGRKWVRWMCGGCCG